MGLDLFAIFLAHGIDRIGINNSSLQEVDPLPKFDSLRVVHFRRKASQGEFLLLEYPLVGNVMDGEYGGRMGKKRVLLVDRFEIGRDQSGLPFMMVDDIRGEPTVLTKIENGFGEEDETFCIIKVITLGGAVEVFPVEELSPPNKVNWDILVEMAQVNIRLELLISDGNLYFFAQILKGMAGFLHHSVIRHD